MHILLYCYTEQVHKSGIFFFSKYKCRNSIQEPQNIVHVLYILTYRSFKMISDWTFNSILFPCRSFLWIQVLPAWCRISLMLWPLRFHRHCCYSLRRTWTSMRLTKRNGRVIRSVRGYKHRVNSKSVCRYIQTVATDIPVSCQNLH